jgi:hypothetical protein
LLHGFYTATSFTVGIRPDAGLEGFIVGPDCSIEVLEGCLTGFGGKSWKLK